METNQNSHVLLVVEDEAILRQTLHDTLKSEGYTVSTAQNGEEGLALALKDHPDLILLDIMMPGMDGMTMLKELRKSQADPKSHVIFLTNLSEVEKIAEALNEGADGYIVKAEASLEEIIGKVKDFFAKNSQ